MKTLSIGSPIPIERFGHFTKRIQSEFSDPNTRMLLAAHGRVYKIPFIVFFQVSIILLADFCIP